jgi:GDP-D-mannose dehydratase
MKRVLITGITGFAGSHLADHILADHPGVEVFGTYRWRSRRENIEHLEGRIRLLESDLGDLTALRAALAVAKHDAIFHLAAQSFVPTSWIAPAETFHINVIGQILCSKRFACSASIRSFSSPARARNTVWCTSTRRRSPSRIRCARSRPTRSRR